MTVPGVVQWAIIGAVILAVVVAILSPLFRRTPNAQVARKDKDERGRDYGGQMLTPSGSTMSHLYRSDAAERVDTYSAADQAKARREYARQAAQRKMDAEAEARFAEAWKRWREAPRLDDPGIVDGEWEDV